MSKAEAVEQNRVKSIEWLLGKWKTTADENGSAFYPTMKEFSYGEEVEFFQVARQPNIQYSFNSFHPETNAPVHRETGFIRVHPNSNRLAFISAHNNGITAIEEGEFETNKITVESCCIGRLSWGKEPSVKKIGKLLQAKGDDTLDYIMYMETSTQPWQEHLKAIYKKV